MKAISVDDTPLAIIQAKADVARVTVLATYATDGTDSPTHVIPLSDPEVRFYNEYYGHKDDQVRQHLIVIGPTIKTSSTDWLPVQKGWNYQSYFGFQGLNSFFKKGIYEVYFYIETKSAAAGCACSARCRVRFK